MKSGFDIRKLERSILFSRTYQLGYETNDTNKFDKNNFSHSYIRPLMAEQVVDVLNSALGVDETFKTAELTAPGRHEDGRDRFEPATKREPGLRASHLRTATANDGLRLRTRRRARPASDAFPHDRSGDAQEVRRCEGPRATLAKSKMTDEELVEDLFFAALTRKPRPDEKEAAVKHLSTAKTRTDAVTDLLWALVNTREFILNH